MSKIVQVGFKLTVPTAEYRQIAASLAQAFAEVPGLRWKMWFLNDQVGTAGAVYLFVDEIARDAFLAGDLVTRLRGASFHRGLEIKLFDVMPEPPGLVGGPVGGAATAGAPEEALPATSTRTCPTPSSDAVSAA